MAIDETESNHSENSESDNDVPNFNERYSNDDNSWLSIDMFNQKDLLKVYIEKHSL
ncbi:hypothetical protein INT45_009295, partial [Circinella minor]